MSLSSSGGDYRNCFESLEIIADGHGEGEQFLESILRCHKLDDNPARFNPDAGGEVFDLLVHDRDGCFDQQMRLGGPLRPELLEVSGHFASALPFVLAIASIGNGPEVSNEDFAVGEAVRSDAVGDAG